MRDRTEVAILRRLFFRRFFDNDLVAPNGGGEQKMSLVYAALIAPGLLISAPLLFKYMAPFWSPGARLILGLDDTFTSLSVSMLVMSIATVVSWDALSLDARDVAMLGPLPIARRTLVMAKLQSLGIFVGSFGVAVNLIPSLLFPPILWGTLQISFLRGVWLVAVHAAVLMAAGCFGFLLMFAVRQVLLLTSNQQLFVRLSAIVQPFLLLLLVTMFLLLPVYPSISRAVRTPAGSLPILGPPGWFLGLHEALSGRLILDAPGVVRPIGRTHQLPPNAPRDRRRYLEFMPEFERRGRTGILAVVIVAMVALGGYAAEGRRIVCRASPATVPRRWWSRMVADSVQCWVVRRPIARATFFFTLQTLARSPSHRLYLSCGLAVACAGLMAFIPREGWRAITSGVAEPALWSISVQPFLVATAAGSLRMVATVPAELRANWTFRATWLRQPDPCMAGVRGAALVVCLLPVAVLALLCLWCWGPSLAVVHLMFGVLTAVTLTEWFLRDLRAVPFTCGSDPASSRALLIRTVVTVIASTVVLGRIESWGYGSPRRAGMAFGAVGVLLLAAALSRQRHHAGWRDPLFDEPMVPPTQRLGISSGTD